MKFARNYHACAQSPCDVRCYCFRFAELRSACVGIAYLSVYCLHLANTNHIAGAHAFFNCAHWRTKLFKHTHTHPVEPSRGACMRIKSQKVLRCRRRRLRRRREILCFVCECVRAASQCSVIVVQGVAMCKAHRERRRC